MGISFEQSGRGPLQFGLPEVSELAVQHGFVKKDAPLHAPLASRADLAAFFKAYDCNALSSFRKRFCEQPLEPINAATFTAAPAATVHAHVAVCVPTVGCGFPPSALTDRSSRGRSRSPDAQPLALNHALACTPEPLERYPELLAKWKSLPWRLARKPGAAHIKTEDYYRLHAASEQVCPAAMHLR